MRTIKILAAVVASLFIILLIGIRSISGNHPPASKTFWLISFVCPKTGHLFVDDVNNPEKNWDFKYAADDTACHFVIEHHLNKALRETQAVTARPKHTETKMGRRPTSVWLWSIAVNGSLALSSRCSSCRRRVGTEKTDAHRLYISKIELCSRRLFFVY